MEQSEKDKQQEISNTDTTILNENSDCKKLEENVKLCFNYNSKSDCEDILEKFEKCKKN
jgi:hypothetical protein